MLEIPVQFKIGDKPLHKTSGPQMLVIGYQYIESGGLTYICIGPDQKNVFCIPYELEPQQEYSGIGFAISFDSEGNQKFPCKNKG